MAKKSAKKKSRKRSSDSPAIASFQPSKSVEMKRIQNGFIVSTFNQKTGRHMEKFAKTQKEAKDLAAKMFR